MARSRFGRTLARVLRRYRLARGLSQEALAEAAGVHRNYVGMVERGELAPTTEKAKRIADALKTSLAALISEAEKT
jgi:transcriptional regulator with XRE-family HTH domain